MNMQGPSGHPSWLKTNCSQPHTALPSRHSATVACELSPKNCELSCSENASPFGLVHQVPPLPAGFCGMQFGWLGGQIGGGQPCWVHASPCSVIAEGVTLAKLPPRISGRTLEQSSRWNRQRRWVAAGGPIRIWRRPAARNLLPLGLRIRGRKATFLGRRGPSHGRPPLLALRGLLGRWLWRRARRRRRLACLGAGCGGRHWSREQARGEQNAKEPCDARVLSWNISWAAL